MVLFFDQKNFWTQNCVNLVLVVISNHEPGYVEKWGVNNDNELNIVYNQNVF